MTDPNPAVARRVAEEVPGMPHDGEGPVFREPWEAQAFAMTLAPSWASMPAAASSAFTPGVWIVTSIARAIRCAIAPADHVAA